MGCGLCACKSRTKTSYEFLLFIYFILFYFLVLSFFFHEFFLLLLTGGSLFIPKGIVQGIVGLWNKQKENIFSMRDVETLGLLIGCGGGGWMLNGPNLHFIFFLLLSFRVAR